MIDVFIIDDSALVRKLLSELIEQEAGMQVLGAAMDPIFAMDRLNKVGWPDVIILDIEMPRMDGITFLKQIMETRPTPVVICSTLSQEKADITLEALSLGAFECIEKPKLGLKDYVHNSKRTFLDAIKHAAKSKPHPTTVQSKPSSIRRKSELSNLSRKADLSQTQPDHSLDAEQNSNEILHQSRKDIDSYLPTPVRKRKFIETTDKIIVIGASTGGTKALEQLLSALPKDCPGIAIVQHMPEEFTKSFAKRLNELSAINVEEIDDEKRIIPGKAFVANGGRHLKILRKGAFYYAKSIAGPLVNRHCPSVDVLFRSTAQAAGPNATGIILTGMGKDGAKGMKDMSDTGSKTIAQDESSSVVFSMPKEAIALIPQITVLPLSKIPGHICNLFDLT